MTRSNNVEHAEPHEERALLFGAPAHLTGILTRPRFPQGEPLGVVLLNAGATPKQGPNRLYVRLARRLAARGACVLRFDHAGVGDSPGRTDGLAYGEALLLETRQAIDLLAEQQGCRRFVLSGICSGGATAYVAARHDERVVGALVINAAGHFHADHPEQVAAVQRRAGARHVRRIALRSSFRAKNLRKLFTGRLPLRRLAGMWFDGWRNAPSVAGAVQVASGTSGQQPDPFAELEALERRGLRVLHVYAEGDEGLDYFHEMLPGPAGARWIADASAVRVLPGMNHLFTQAWAQEELLSLALDWIGALAP